MQFEQLQIVKTGQIQNGYMENEPYSFFKWYSYRELFWTAQAFSTVLTFGEHGQDDVLVVGRRCARNWRPGL